MTVTTWCDPVEMPQPPRLWARGEELLLTLILAAMLVIPIAEGVARAVFHTGISGSAAIVQHCTLLISMFGAALAARDNRLLALATAAYLSGTTKRIAQLVSSAVGASVSVFLALSGYEMVRSEQLTGSRFVYGLPLWIVQSAIPIGFAIIAVRIILTSAESRRARLVAAVMAAALVASPLVVPSAATILGWISLALAAICGAPLFALLGGATLILNWGAGIPVAAAALSHYSLVVNPALPAIPLFTLAGYILAEGGASQRLVRVFRAVVGNLRGGPAIVTTLACAFFTSFTGGSGVTILALGGLLLPILIEANYSEKNALGLVTAAGSLGLLLPPCLPMILYGIAAQVDMREIFLGAFFPGCLLLAGTAFLGVRQQSGLARSEPFSFHEALAAVRIAKWELLLPAAVIVVLLNGWATPVEAAAMTALYAFGVETIVYRGLRSREAIMKVFTETALLVGGILLILGVALAFTAYLVDAEVPVLATEWMTAHVESKLLFLLLLNVALLVVGAMMDIYSAIIVVVPLIIPIGRAYGIDPVHLGVIFLANLELGYLIPPVGENLFISSYRFHKPLVEVYRATIPMIIVFGIAVLIITYYPPLTTWLPRYFAR